MGEREDGLGLTLGLSLKCPDQNFPPPLPFNLHSIFQTPKLSSLADAFQSSPDARSNLRGIDVNRRPSRVAECEDEVGVSSPNSTISSVSGKREENGTERGWATGGCGGEEEDDDGGDTAERKKLRLSKEQAAVLEETFKEHSTLKPKQKVSLANQLNLRTRQVEVWFQNRRARTKLKQTEVDCEYLKRCYDNLTEENRRLQKEANELRALKLSPQTYMHMNPPTTLTMCPSCERVAVLPPPSPAAAIGITRHLMPVRSTPGNAWPFNSNNSQAA
ncbi:Homeobox-leucine zipper protein [Actinidia chinensis var. chinensis]|uniref:Homeobox-leucine zipper protein n=1 Tax=Actinidia chinensis var. chinensis TaxID=1590841 RepID=A0A2R6R981_ACTCC|nr:Homeobox-leucine zipper protein [Actinidia chinensis var. chinensis]